MMIPATTIRWLLPKFCVWCVFIINHHAAPILTIHQQKETSKEKLRSENRITFHLIAGTHKTPTETVPVHHVSVMLDAKMAKNVHFALKGLHQSIRAFQHSTKYSKVKLVLL